MTELLPQECAPVSDRQRALTTRYLEPAQRLLEAGLTALRREIDPDLIRQIAARSAKAYPIGCCHEITLAVLARLQRLLASSTHGSFAALTEFVAAGGEIRQVWGVLRDRYFQNALQVGALYIDVANDTVDPTKPPVEIRPFAEAGFAPVRGPEHFARIAASYWGADTFANHAVPELAPLMPMITQVPGEPPLLQSPSDYMTDLFRQDGFLTAEIWLAEALPPPPAVVAVLRQRWSALHPSSGTPEDGLARAVAACRSARSLGLHRDMHWRDARLTEYVRAFGTGPARAEA